MAYAANGDMITRMGQRFRRIAWRINGGPNDGKIVQEMTDEHKAQPHGGFSPVYIEVGDD